MKKVSPEEKALQYIAFNRLDVIRVDHDAGVALVHVKSGTTEGDPYFVQFNGEWHCDCPARVTPCVHITAAKKVVHMAAHKPSLAAEPADDTAWLDSFLGSGK